MADGVGGKETTTLRRRERRDDVSMTIECAGAPAGAAARPPSQHNVAAILTVACKEEAIQAAARRVFQMPEGEEAHDKGQTRDWCRSYEGQLTRRRI